MPTASRLLVLHRFHFSHPLLAWDRHDDRDGALRRGPEGRVSLFARQFREARLVPEWIAETTSGAELLGSPDASSAADLNASVQTVQATRVVPVDRIAVALVVVAAGIRMLAVVATLMPLARLGQWIVSAIFWKAKRA